MTRGANEKNTSTAKPRIAAAVCSYVGTGPSVLRVNRIACATDIANVARLEALRPNRAKSNQQNRFPWAQQWYRGLLLMGSRSCPGSWFSAYHNRSRHRSME